MSGDLYHYAERLAFVREDGAWKILEYQDMKLKRIKTSLVFGGVAAGLTALLWLIAIWADRHGGEAAWSFGLVWWFFVAWPASQLCKAFGWDWDQSNAHPLLSLLAMVVVNGLIGFLIGLIVGSIRHRPKVPDSDGGSNKT